MVFKTDDCVKAERAPGLSPSQKGFMMELQDLQDALKVEIQVHQKLVAQMKQDPQNAELKKQLHELQTKITTLSDKQKKVVEQLRKDLLVKQDHADTQTQNQLQPQAQPQTQAQPQPQPQTQTQTQTQAQTQAPYPLQLELQVQAQPLLLSQPQHPVQPEGRNSSLPPLNTPPSLPSPDNLSSPQNALPGSPVISSKSLPLLLSPAVIPSPRPSVAMVTAFSHASKPSTTHPNSQNAPVHLQTSCQLTNQGLEPVRLVSKNTVVVQSSSQPIRVPQFVPPRLAPRPACQPQVRPRPAQPALQAPPPMLAPPQLPPRPVLLASQLSASSLPPSPAPIHQVRILNGQPCTGSAQTKPPGQLNSIIITPLTTPLATPHTHLSPTSKVVKAQAVEPKSSSSAPPSPAPRNTPPPPAPPLTRTKQEESPQKLAFMVSLGLVTFDHLEEIQTRRQERKRRTTANPVYSGAAFQPERKKNTLLYLNSPHHQANRKRANEDPLSEADVHEDLCAVCQRSGQLLMCDTCSRVYHLDCLAPPLKTVPRGMWMCPSCHNQMLEKEDAMEWPGTLAIVHSYIAYKAAKEEEKQRQVKWARDLRLEREQLELRVKQLNTSITRCMESKNSVLSRQRSMQMSLEKVRGLLRLIQGLKALPPAQATPPPPQELTNGGPAPPDLTNGGTDSSAADHMEHSPEEPPPHNNANHGNNNNNNHDNTENNNNDMTENNNNDITDNNSSSSDVVELSSKTEAVSVGEERERAEEGEVKKEEVKIVQEKRQEDKKEVEEEKESPQPDSDTQNIDDNQMNRRATEMNNNTEEKEEETTEGGKVVEGGREEEAEEVKEEEEEVGGKEEEEEDGEKKEEEERVEKEEGGEEMEEDSVDRFSSLDKVSEPNQTLPLPSVGVAE